MEQIIAFLNEVFSLERDAIEKQFDSDVSVFNEKYDNLMLFSNYPSISFEMSRLSTPFTEALEDFPEFLDFKEPPPVPRHIFKISKYSHPKYREIYAVYVSTQKPQPTVGLYSKCFMVGWINNNLKIISQFSFADPNLVKRRWMFTGGDQEVTFETLGKPIEILRLLPPKDDPDSMEDYLLDK